MGVARARWGEAARRGSAFHPPLVPLDHAHKSAVTRSNHVLGHRVTLISSSWTSWRNSSNERSTAAGRAPTSNKPWPSDERLGGVGKDVAKTSPQAIARDRRADRPTNGEGHTRRHRRGIVHVSTPQGRRRGATAMTGQRLELSSLANPTDQADRRWRPLRRRARRMARPERVRMRARNPCLRARRRVFGW